MGQYLRHAAGPLCGMAAPAILSTVLGIQLGDIPEASVLSKVALIVLLSTIGTVAWTLVILVPQSLLRVFRALRGPSEEVAMARAVHAYGYLVATSVASWLAIVAVFVAF